MIITGLLIWLILVGSKPLVRIAMVGNSYTYANDLPEQLETMLNEASEDKRYQVTVFAQPAHTLSDHLGDLAPKLDAGFDTTRNKNWDYLILQEQSQVSGFPASHPDFQNSLGPVAKFAEYSVESDTNLVLFETWGYFMGDNSNPDIYRDFDSMQKRISTGYERYETKASLEGARVTVAKVGSCWLKLSNSKPQLVELEMLYAEDGSHPSQLGSVLASAILAANINPEFAPTSIIKEHSGILQFAADNCT